MADIQVFGKVKRVTLAPDVDTEPPTFEVTYRLIGQEAQVKQLEVLMAGNADCVIVTRAVK